MSVNLRIMNWNIQNYGVTKSGFKFNNFDLSSAIAEVVVSNEVDIFVMLEMNTSDAATARGLAHGVAAALSQKAGSEYSAVLSPNTGREFYAFFVRDANFTIPAPLTGVDGQPSVPPMLGSESTPLAKATFTCDPTIGGIRPAFFPLLEPDLPEYGRSRSHEAVWTPGYDDPRFPVLGLFKIEGASPANAYLPIVACHFAAHSLAASRQIELLRCFSLLAGLGPQPTTAGYPPRVPATLQIVSGGVAPGPGAYQLANYVVLGDFNIDYSLNKRAYTPLAGSAWPNLGTTAGLITSNTIFIPTKDYSSRDYHDTAKLLCKCYDNFFLKTSSIPPVKGRVPDLETNLAKSVIDRSIELGASVGHYAELGQRGLDNTIGTVPLVQDLGEQLTNSETMVSLGAALAGARLISDHIPVVVDLLIP